MRRTRYLFISFCALCCLMLSTQIAYAQLNLADGYASGQWYNPARDGEGFYVEVIGAGDNLAFAVAMYSYDAEGNQLWLVGTVPIEDGDTGATVPVIRVEGPVWGTAYDPADAVTTEFGNIVVQFPSCDSAMFNVQSNVQGLGSGSYSLIRLTEIVGMNCVEPPPPEPPDSQPPGSTEISPGLWTGNGLCFFVNNEATQIVESDQCGLGNSFSGDAPGTIINLTPYSYGNPDTGEPCNAEVSCVGAWDIVPNDNPYEAAFKEATCLTQSGGIGKIKFVVDLVGVTAVAQMLDGEAEEITNNYCHAGRYDDFTATPAQ